MCWGRGEERCGGSVTLVLRFGCTLRPRNRAVWEGGVSTRRRKEARCASGIKKDGSRNHPVSNQETTYHGQCSEHFIRFLEATSIYV